MHLLTKNIEKAGYKENPLEDAVLQDYNVVPVKITTLTEEALKDSGLDQKSIVKCKNMFALWYDLLDVRPYSGSHERFY